jgi:glycosyltransferase 2 family protein
LKFYNKFIVILVSVISLYAGFLIVSDFNQITTKINTLKFDYLPIIVLLAPCSWFMLFLRWHYLLKNSNINLPFIESLKINLAGYALSVTPGKVGELIKAHFMKSNFGIPQKNTIPIIMMEQFYTLLGLVCVGLFGVWYFEFGFYVFSAIIAMLIFLFVVIFSSTLFQRIVNLSSKIPFLSKYTETMSKSHEIIRQSIKKPIFFKATLLSMAFWFIESILVYFVILSFNISHLDLLKVVSIYAVSIILGAISFLPLGIGVVEGSLAGFFILQKIDVSIALTLVIMIRILTRWYAVSVGVIALRVIGGFSFKNNDNSKD